VEEAKSPVPESVMFVPVEFRLAESSPIEHPVSTGPSEVRVLSQGASAHFTASEGTLGVMRSARAGVDHMVTRHEHAAPWPMHRHSATRPTHHHPAARPMHRHSAAAPTTTGLRHYYRPAAAYPAAPHPAAAAHPAMGAGQSAASEQGGASHESGRKQQFCLSRNHPFLLWIHVSDFRRRENHSIRNTPQ
jgi:hypothetical protein